MTEDTLLPSHPPAVQRKTATAAFDGGLISFDIDRYLPPWG